MLCSHTKPAVMSLLLITGNSLNGCFADGLINVPTPAAEILAPPLRSEEQLW